MFLALLLFGTSALASAQTPPGQPDDLLQRAAAHVAAGQLAAAEGVYRAALAESPGSRDAALGLARILLWRLKVAESEALFRDILQRNPGDLDAREGVATIRFWRGDLAAAASALRHIVERDSSRATAREMLHEIDAALEPRYGAAFHLTDDDQPYRRSTSRLTGAFSAWNSARVDAAASFERFETSTATDRAFALAISASRYVRPLESSVTATLEPMRFPNGDTTMLGRVSLAHRLVRSQSTLTIAVQRDDILATAAAVERQATVTRAEASWAMERANGWLAGAHAEGLRYFDDNDGHGAHAYVLAPVRRGGQGRAWAGVSAAHRDTTEGRFRLSRFRAVPQASGGFRYLYEGVYDPYWTPHDLWEARAVIAAEHRWNAWTGSIHIDGGIAHDDAIGFGPASGTSPLPVIAAATFSREFHPWRASVSISRVLGPLEVRIGYERSVTVFYEAHEYHASLAGRF